MRKKGRAGEGTATEHRVSLSGLVLSPCRRAPLAASLHLRCNTPAQVLKGCVRSLRNARAEYNVEPGRKIGATLVVEDEATRKVCMCLCVWRGGGVFGGACTAHRRKRVLTGVRYHGMFHS